MSTAIAKEEDIKTNQSGSGVYSHSASFRNETPLPSLVVEALENNPEIRAALKEREAAQQRIAPAEALDDPMLEAGVINAPLASSP